jgi:hypothetical protein
VNEEVYMYKRILGTVVVVVITLAIPTMICKVGAQPRHTQPAQTCVNRHDYPAGTNNFPNAFSRFYNTCSFTISLMLTTNGHGNNGPGAPGTGAFMVMGWPDNIPKDVHYFACVYPGKPVKPGSTSVNLPSYGDSNFDCLVP